MPRGIQDHLRTAAKDDKDDKDDKDYEAEQLKQELTGRAEAIKWLKDFGILTYLNVTLIGEGNEGKDDDPSDTNYSLRSSNDAEPLKNSASKRIMERRSGQHKMELLLDVSSSQESGVLEGEPHEQAVQDLQDALNICRAVFSQKKRRLLSSDVQPAQSLTCSIATIVRNGLDILSDVIALESLSSLSSLSSLAAVRR
ncbi:hypothetical protein BC939DRAFT_500825 [Gamsiella multidivaricata]|uniref:uncharacterized protein n=1 Tax=Gamsiella multidivaricata TaxID=101098 RepID=UPI00221F5B1F|nr:uncharacterized protein BC939DRAFT_500825 [Gamsiella multidivaricata]KAI7828161.1 hypothetical protein BC939DRAFT_500825 [Gamsiella multidivaricata]